jgi:tripeptidyl-peptidase-1
MVRTTTYSLPSNIHSHVDVVQPTTMFGRFKGSKSTISWPDETETISLENLPPIADAVSGTVVDASCNTTITISCLQQLYNAVGFTPSSKGNSVGITGYLEENANIQDLQSFYADQRPDALGSSFEFFSVKGLF